jgi:hypothetical protein
VGRAKTKGPPFRQRKRSNCAVLPLAGASLPPSAPPVELLLTSSKLRFEQLLDQLAEEGADEAARRYLIPNRVVAKGVQLRRAAAAARSGW